MRMGEGEGRSGGGDGEKEAFNTNELLVCVEGWVDCLIYLLPKLTFIFY